MDHSCFNLAPLSHSYVHMLLFAHRYKEDIELWISLLSDALFTMGHLINAARPTLNYLINLVRIGYTFTMSDIKTIVVPVVCHSIRCLGIERD